MSEEETKAEVPKTRFGALVKYLTKTAIRMVIWVGLAYGILFLFPEQTWVWWVVIVFVGISVAWALFLFVAGIASGDSDET